MSDPSFIVVTGMHRSNTSLLGMFLDSCGVKFGNNLVDGNESNPYGHFEDIELMTWHEDVLRKNNSSWKPVFKRNYRLDNSDKAKMQGIVKQNLISDDCVHGFKVPHATLFLDEWGQYPEAKFVFIFREPQAVIRSLLKRAGRQLLYKPYFPVNCGSTYWIYNKRIYDFYQKHSERCYLIHSDDLTSEPSRVLSGVANKLDIEYASPPNESLYDKNVIGRKAGNLVEFYTRLICGIPAIQNVYEDLIALCDSKQIK